MNADSSADEQVTPNDGAVVINSRYVTAPDRNVIPHVIVLQHGSHGKISDFGFLVHQLVEHHGFRYCRDRRDKRWWWPGGAGGELLPHDELFASPRLILDTTANERLKSDRGTLNCVNEMVKELVPLLEQFVTIYTPRPPLVESPSTAQSSSSLSGPLSPQHGVPPPRVRISCVGHSFGGILLRAFLAALKADHATLWSQLDFEVFMTVATPHLGVRGLNRILRKGGELIGKVYSATYRDLLLMSEDHGPLANELITETALDVLAQFRVRRLYANTNKDILVSFATASLLVEGAKEHHRDPKTGKVGAPTPVSHHMLPTIYLDPGDCPPMHTETQVRAGMKDPIEVRIAHALRSRMSFEIVPTISHLLFAMSHTQIVSSQRYPWQRLMDDVGVDMAVVLAGGTIDESLSGGAAGDPAQQTTTVVDPKAKEDEEELATKAAAGADDDDAPPLAITTSTG
jgi:hypothetical protein